MNQAASYYRPHPGFIAGVRQVIKRSVLDSPLYDFYMERRYRKNYDLWVQAGRPNPPPHYNKQLAIREYAERNKCTILVETGTFLGDMLYAMKSVFKALHTIELDEFLHKKATERFRKHPHIKLHQGDSGIMLAKIMPLIKEPALFWLDGHYSGGITAQADLDTPIVEELITIMKHGLKHVILIDDARDFNGTNDYPTIPVLEAKCKELFPKHSFLVKDDIIRLEPIR